MREFSLYALRYLVGYRNACMAFFLCGIFLFTSGILSAQMNSAGLDFTQHKLAVCADSVISQGSVTTKPHMDEDPCNKPEFNKTVNIA